MSVGLGDRLGSPVIDTPPIPVEVTTTTTVAAKPVRPENWRSLILVGAALAAILIAAAYWVLGTVWGSGVMVLALFEAWTLTNRYKEDTISEAMWILSQRPIVVHAFGVAIGFAAGQGWLGDPVTVLRVLMLGELCGHFWFSKSSVSFSTTMTTEAGR